MACRKLLENDLLEAQASSRSALRGEWLKRKYESCQYRPNDNHATAVEAKAVDDAIRPSVNLGPRLQSSPILPCFDGGPDPSRLCSNETIETLIDCVG